MSALTPEGAEKVCQVPLIVPSLHRGGNFVPARSEYTYAHARVRLPFMEEVLRGNPR